MDLVERNTLHLLSSRSLLLGLHHPRAQAAKVRCSRAEGDLQGCCCELDCPKKLCHVSLGGGGGGGGAREGARGGAGGETIGENGRKEGMLKLILSLQVARASILRRQ
eukprot:669268-Hanusia_phi.AAC.1